MGKSLGETGVIYVAKKPLSKTIKRFYGVGDFGFNLMALVEIYFFVFFLTDIAKLPLGLVAIIGTVTSVVDAVTSPFYGAIISGTKPMRWGRNRSWILLLPPLVVPTYMLMYTKIGSDLVAAIIICAGFIVSHILWNIPWVANLSLIPVLATNPDEAALLSSRRATWTALGGIVFSFVGEPLARYFGEVTNNPILGYTLLAGATAIVMMLCYWFIFKITDGYEPTGADAAVGPADEQRVSFKVMWQSIVQNPPLIILLISDFFRNMTMFVMTAAAAYYFTYVVQNMALFPTYLLAISIVQMIGSYISGNVAKKLSTRTATLISLFGLAVSLIICKFVAMNLALFFVFVLIATMFLGIVTSVMVGLYSDVSVYARWKTGEDASAFIMGLMTVALKLAIISRGTVIPFILDRVGFDPNIDPAAATLALKTGIVNAYLLVPGIFALISAIILVSGYKLTRERVIELQSEINQRELSTAKTGN